MLVDRLGQSPNPQFSRPNWVDLTGEWKFRFDDADEGIRARWFDLPEQFDRVIAVPYPPESELSGINDKGYHPVSWYARSVEIGASATEARHILNFGAVDYHAIVWVDGDRVGEHRGGHTPFSIDITDALNPDTSEHWIVVRAFDDPVDIEQPRGKQDWLPEPHVIWYDRTSGIWQPVWLEEAPAARITSLRWRFVPENWQLDYEIELSCNPEPDSTLKIELELEGKPIATVAASASSRVVSGQIGLRGAIPPMQVHALLWSPARPNLIGATVSLEGGDTTDVVESYLGLRSIDLRGRRIRINEGEVFLRFVLNQGYWPESHLTAPSPEALKREVELILELGFNGARIHQKVEDPRFLYWADRLGLLLWGEIANSFTFTERAIDQHLEEWRESVLRDRNHPSIIAWVPFNESWGIGEVGRSVEQQEAVHAAYHRTHTLDGTRPVIGNDGWENVAGDLVTIHDYSWDPETLRNRYTTEEQLGTTLETYFPGGRIIAVGEFDTDDKPVMVTEFGGVSFAPDSGEEWFGYGKVRTPEEFEEQYRALTEALSSSDLICGFCYTQLTDTLQETNGLLTEHREPKIPMEKLRAITRSGSRKV
jgi:beta-galactosidase/beta-glucuronidase